MQEHTFWTGWAHFLQHWGLREPAATILDSAGPLTVLLAQLVYFGKPFFGGALPVGQWDALAQMLECREDSRSFATFLRGEELH